ncbi:MAG TPA: GspH/FimT family pseudopilin [Nitrospirota bacterium]|nr:GspH/FimT family pseudopilin [Nitrospirota bacterium]
MNYTRWMPYNVVRSPKGFTLIELVMVMTIMGIVCAIALPPFLSWQKNLGYRTTARGVVAALREARSRAITDNQPHQVIIDSANKQYRLADYTMWTSIAPEVSLNTGATTTPYVVQYNPNGTSSGGTINVQDTVGTQHFQIVVNTTGRVVVTP